MDNSKTIKKAILLVNLGTPLSPNVTDVRTYLSEFLNDPRVIDIPWLARKLLVNLIIVPFRAPKSAKVYKELWTKEGSPLLLYSESLQIKLSKVLGEAYYVELAMRYQEPSLKKALEKIKKLSINELIIVPLFPQYASASTGSVIEKVLQLMKDWYVYPDIKIISQFYNKLNFTDLFVQNGLKYNLNEYDHVLFSFHGLPERQVDKVYENGLCVEKGCEEKITSENYYCYKATCYETARKIASGLNLSENKYTVCFQSRLGKDPWIKPYSDEVIIDLAKNGIKKILAFSPAFVADCLETTIEIGEEYSELFIEHGGEKLDLVESLNDSEHWVEYLSKLIRE